MVSAGTWVTTSALAVLGAARDAVTIFFTISILQGFGSVGIRRAADKYAPYALLKKTRRGERPKQDSADLPIKTRLLGGVESGQLHTGRAHEQLPEAPERLFDAACLQWLRHMRYSSQLWRPGSREET